MKLNEIKSELKGIENLQFILPNGSFIPAHFHITEVGSITRNFIDCGGTVRNETVINFQLWEDAGDTEHRLSAEKLLSIIELSEEKIGLPNTKIEVEYQQDTISKFGLEFENGTFLLTSTETDCLAKDKCGIPAPQKINVSMASLGENSCEPGSGCC